MLIQKRFYLDYDLDATTLKYGRMKGPYNGISGVKTVGNVVTVTGMVAALGVFGAVKVGDRLLFVKGETQLPRRCAVKTNANQIDVESAIDLDNGGNGYPSWYHMPFDIGATDVDGWLSCEELVPGSKSIRIEASAIQAAGGLDISIETVDRLGSARPAVSLTKNYPAGAAVSDDISVPETVAAIRLGVKGNAGFAGTDSIYAWLIGEPRY